MGSVNASFFVFIGSLALVVFNIFLARLPAIQTYYPLLALSDGIGIFFLIGFLVVERHERQRFSLLDREHEKLRLSLSDRERESSLLLSLNDIISVFETDPQIDTVLNRIADTSQRLLKADSLTLQIFSSEKRSYFARVIKGVQDTELADALVNTLVEDAVHPNRSVLVNNTASFSRFVFLTQKGYHSLLVVPLKIRGEGIGLLAALGLKTNLFTNRDLDLAIALSTQVSLLVENATLLEKTRCLSITDGLTSLYNRRYFEELLGRQIEQAGAVDRPFTVAMFDVDHFKRYNDAHGHLAGDQLLRDVSRILQEGTKGSDIVARYGGEEFVIIFSDTGCTEAAMVCNRLREKVSRRLPAGGDNGADRSRAAPTISVGVASYPTDGIEPAAILGEADKRLYQAKHLGRNRVVSTTVEV